MRRRALDQLLLEAHLARSSGQAARLKSRRVRGARIAVYDAEDVQVFFNGVELTDWQYVSMTEKPQHHG